MRAERLLRRLYDAGFAVRADDGDVVVRPARLLTSRLRRQIRAQKVDLLEALAEGSVDPPEPLCVDCGRTLPLSGVRCPDCRDALDALTCASCGVEVEGADLSFCELCGIEAHAPIGAKKAEDSP